MKTMNSIQQRIVRMRVSTLRSATAPGANFSAHAADRFGAEVYLSTRVEGSLTTTVTTTTNTWARRGLKPGFLAWGPPV